MLWIFVSFAAGAAFWWGQRKRKLDRDSVQIVLSALILDMAHQRFSDQACKDFIERSLALASRVGGASVSTRYAHALSRARARLSADDYQQAQRIVDLICNTPSNGD